MEGVFPGPVEDLDTLARLPTRCFLVTMLGALKLDGSFGFAGPAKLYYAQVPLYRELSTRGSLIFGIDREYVAKKPFTAEEEASVPLEFCPLLGIVRAISEEAFSLQVALLREKERLDGPKPEGITFYLEFSKKSDLAEAKKELKNRGFSVKATGFSGEISAQKEWGPGDVGRIVEADAEMVHFAERHGGVCTGNFVGPLD